MTEGILDRGKGPAETHGFRVERDPHHERADIVLDRPPVNLLTVAQCGHLRSIFETLDCDPQVRVIVLRAVGKNFCAGGDVKDFHDARPEEVAQLTWNVAAPARCSKPVIAASRGVCFGTGFEYYLACDFRLASENSQFALPEQMMATIPGASGAARLQRMIGSTRTKDFILRARRMSAQQALQWGIVTALVPDVELETQTEKIVDELRGLSPVAQRLAKKLLNDCEDSPLTVAAALEWHSYSQLRYTKDAAEGVRAFLEKRKPKFTGA